VYPNEAPFDVRMKEIALNHYQVCCQQNLAGERAPLGFLTRPHSVQLLTPSEARVELDREENKLPAKVSPPRMGCSRLRAYRLTPLPTPLRGYLRLSSSSLTWILPREENLAGEAVTFRMVKRFLLALPLVGQPSSRAM
jgi:hypothetical protein